MKRFFSLLCFIACVSVLVFSFVGCQQEETPYDPYEDLYAVRITGFPDQANLGTYTYLNIYRVGDDNRTTSIARSDGDEYTESSITYILYTAIAGGILGGSVTYKGDGGPFIIELDYRKQGSPDFYNPVYLYVKNKTLQMGLNTIPYSDFRPW